MYGYGVTRWRPGTRPAQSSESWGGDEAVEGSPSVPRTWEEDVLSRRTLVAFVGAVALLISAVVFDAVGTLGNVISDVLLASTITVTYHVLVSRKRRDTAQDLAWHALRPLHIQLEMIGRQIDHHRQQLEKLESPDPDEQHDGWAYPASLHHSAAADLLGSYYRLKTICPGPDLERDANVVAAHMQDLVGLDGRLYQTLMHLETPSKMTSRADQETTRRSVRELVPLFKEKLSDLERARNALYVKVAVLYHPQLVGERMSPDPFAPALLKASLGVAVLAGFVWLGGLWPGRYAADVLDNVLVGLSGVLIGVGVVAATSSSRHHWLTRQAANPKAELMLALGSIESWAHQGSDRWPLKRSNDPEMQELADQWTEEARRSRRRLRRSLHWLQYISTDARLDALGDAVDDLVIGGLEDPDNTTIFNQLHGTAETLRNHVEQLFPPEYNVKNLLSDQGLILRVEDPESVQSWDADLVDLGPDDVPDPSRGPWARRADRNRQIRGI